MSDNSGNIQFQVVFKCILFCRARNCGDEAVVVLYLMLLFLREIWAGLDSRPVDPMALQKCDLRSESHPEPCWSHFVPLPIAAPRNASLKGADIN